MRASVRALVLGCVMVGCVAGAASAAPILGGTAGGACPVLVAAPSCGLFSIDPLSATPLSVSLASQRDVLLLEFELLADSIFAVTTAPFHTSEALGPVLGVFYGSPLDEHYLEVVTFPEPGSDAELRALGEGVSPSDPSLPGLTPLMLGQGIYLLAVLSPTNFFGGVPVESLTAAFSLDFDDVPCASDEGCAFSVSVGATPVGGGPAPVPEPATLTLVAGGALAGWLQRRRAKTRKPAAVSR